MTLYSSIFFINLGLYLARGKQKGHDSRTVMNLRPTAIVHVIRQFRKLYFILFLGSGFSVPLWDFVGTTMVTNNYVRLTPDYQSRQGGIWNTMVIKEC